jgi:hypothetical protein
MKETGLGDENTKSQLKLKLDKMRERSYVLALLNVLSTINYFAMGKGNFDIRPVYDGT